MTLVQDRDGGLSLWLDAGPVLRLYRGRACWEWLGRCRVVPVGEA